MATQIIKMRIQFRRDTTENWLLNKDVIPAAGEPCYDLDIKTLKIGDGSTTYENLPVVGGEESIVVAADGKSIVLKDGIFELVGFDAAEVGAQPRKNADGLIEWVVPSVDESIDTLLVEVDALRTDVTNLQEIVTPSGEDAIPLLTRVETLEVKMDGTGEGSVDAKIDAKIKSFAESMTADGKVNTLMELINYVESHGTEAADMATDIKELQENVIREIAVNGTLLDVVDGRVDISIAEQTLGVKGSDEIDVAEDGTLSIKSISIDKIVQNEDDYIIMDGGGAA